MSLIGLADLHSRRPAAAALLVAAGSAFALAAAWFFQLALGFAPCPLCLDQRIAYYAGVPLALVAFAATGAGWRGLARVLLAVLAVMMLANMVLAIYHSGIEWRWWPGPASCTGAPVVATDILGAIKGARVPRCDEAAWRLLGLSMAGWNGLIAAALAGVAALGTTMDARR